MIANFLHSRNAGNDGICQTVVTDASTMACPNRFKVRVKWIKRGRYTWKEARAIYIFLWKEPNIIHLKYVASQNLDRKFVKIGKVDKDTQPTYEENKPLISLKENRFMGSYCVSDEYDLPYFIESGKLQVFCCS